MPSSSIGSPPTLFRRGVCLTPKMSQKLLTHRNTTSGIVEAQLLREDAFEQPLARQSKVCASEISGGHLDARNNTEQAPRRQLHRVTMAEETASLLEATIFAINKVECKRRSDAVYYRSRFHVSTGTDSGTTCNTDISAIFWHESFLLLL